MHGQHWSVVANIHVTLHKGVVAVINATAAGTLCVHSTNSLVANLRLSDVVHLLGLGLLGGDPMREKCLVDLEQGLFVIDKQVKQIALVTIRKVGDLDPVLCKLR